MKNVLYTVLAITISLAAGKFITNSVGGLPASLYGMLLYCMLFQLGWLAPSKVHQANLWIIKHMGVCFIPAAVGVINHFDLIKNHGVLIVGIIFFTTFLLLTFVGVFAEKYLTPQSKPASSASHS